MNIDWSKILDRHIKNCCDDPSLKGLDSIENAANIILKDIYKDITYEYDRLEKKNTGLKRVIIKKYNRAILDLDVWINLINDFTISISQYYWKNHDYIKDGKIDICVRLFGRQIHTANEIQVLLANGFPDGAQARWRTLYELHVYMMFINEFGDDIAKMYSDHEDIERYWLAKYLNKNIDKIDEISEITNAFYEKKKKYGEDFIYNLGWTLKVLPERKDRNIEMMAKSSKNLDPRYHLNYKIASENIHGNMFGLSYKLGNSINQGNRILTQGTELGLEDPFIETIDVLFQSFSLIISLVPSIYSTMYYTFIAAMGKMIKENLIKKKSG